MPRLSSPTALARWMVVMTFWLAALLPAAAMASAALNGELAPWTQLCRASVVSPRAEELRAAQQGNGDTAHDQALFQHCAFCHLHHDALDLPPQPQLPALRTDLRHGLPERFFSASVTAHAWRHALARAPPLTV